MRRGPRESTRPPAIVRILLRLLLPATEREFYLGDLEEGGSRPWVRELLGAVSLRFSRPGRRPGATGGWNWSVPVGRWFADLRFGMRRWLRTPAATLTALVAMSIGIGLSTLMFSLIHGVLLPTLPHPAGERIVRVNRVEYETVTVATFEYWRERQRSFEGLSAWVERPVNLTIEGHHSEPVHSAAIDATVLSMLSVQPVVGRGFTGADARPGAPAVVLIGYATWRTRFDGEAGVLGRTVRVNGEPAEIIGVLPEGFRFPQFQELWTPLRLDALRDAGELRSLFGVLHEGVSRSTAMAELNALDTQRPKRAGEPEELARVEVAAYTDLINPRGRSELLGAVMLGVALLVLLIACANATNVLLAQSAVRAREVAVRTALGASRIRIITQFWLEVSLLAFAGAVGGVLLAFFGLRVIRSRVPFNGFLPYWWEFRVDTAVLGFVVLATVLAAMLAGVAPALHASRTSGHELLKDNSRGSSSRRLGRTMRRLIAVEMAVSFVLLVAAGLFIRSVVNLSRYPFPFERAGVFISPVQLPEGRYTAAPDRARLIERLEQSLAAIPGLSGSAVATSVPGVSAARRRVAIEGIDRPDDDDLPETRMIAATGGYFAMFGAAPIAGRGFLRSDDPDGLPVAIVNRAFERTHVPDGAVGHRIALAAAGDEATWLTIVGVVPDLLEGGVERELEEAIYRPLAQDMPTSFMILVRSAGPPASLPERIRDAAATADPDAALFITETLEDRIDGAHGGVSWLSALFLIAGTLALFLAAIGLYGVMAFWVVQRTREIGVRMALGSGRRAIVRMVLRQGLTQVATGLLAGMVVAAPVAWLFGLVLLGVRPFDPFVFGLVPAVLLAAGSIGCALPALRATRVDPQVALAAE